MLKTCGPNGSAAEELICKRQLTNGAFVRASIVKLCDREPFGQDYALLRQREEEAELGWDAKDEQRSGVKLLCSWQEEMSLIVDHRILATKLSVPRHFVDSAAVAGW